MDIGCLTPKSPSNHPPIFRSLYPIALILQFSNVLVVQLANSRFKKMTTVKTTDPVLQYMYEHAINLPSAEPTHAFCICTQEWQTVITTIILYLIARLQAASLRLMLAHI